MFDYDVLFWIGLNVNFGFCSSPFPHCVQPAIGKKFTLRASTDSTSGTARYDYGMIANSTAIVKSNKHETWTGSPAMKSAQISPAGHASHSGNGDDARWRAVLDRDVRQDGKFFYAVSSTGVFCRRSCPARRPRRGGVVFLDTAAEAERAGFRACLRCRPLEGDRPAL